IKGGGRAPCVEMVGAARRVPAAALVSRPVFAHAVGVWRVDQDFSFGFLIPPVSLALAALRWRELVAARRAGPAASLLVLAAGLVLLVAGSHSDVHALAAVSFLPVVLGAAAYLFCVPAAPPL